MMITASTMAPMAMAMPPSDMMLAVMPIPRKGMNAISTAIGIVSIGMSALGMCHKNSSTTSDTVMITSITVVLRVSIEW